MDRKTKILLKKLKKTAEKIMGNGKYYHDFAHCMGVYKNIEKLLVYKQGNKLALLIAALFHDIKRDYKNHGSEGAKCAEKILREIPEFPEKITKRVAQIINSHDKKQKTKDEKLFYDADKMDAFNELGIARSLMMYASEGFSLKEACFRLHKLYKSFYRNLNTTIAKRLVKNNYKKIKVFTQRLIKRYEK